MLRSWKIGRLFGINIYLHWTFWILPLIVIYGTKAYTGAATVALALAFVGCAAFFIVLHEFGHILTARAFGIGTKDVILTPLGGMARMERMSEKPSEEILISLAGPAVNVVCATVLSILTLPLISSTPIPGPLRVPTQPIATGLELLAMVIYVNVVMAIFNMLPAFPMDGGRIFRGVMATFMDRVIATTIAAWVGMFVIAAVGFVFFLEGSVLAPVLAVFIGLLAHLELAMVKRVDLMRRKAAHQRWYGAEPSESAALVMAGLPPEPGFSGYSWNARDSAWIEWRDGNPVRACRMRAG